MTNYPDYEGYEELGRFTPAQLQAYREMLLAKTWPQVNLIGKHLVKGKPLSVFEIGSGNGRLLIGLNRAGMLEEGVGFDLSESRVEFANTWARDLGIIVYEEDMFFVQDILTYPHHPGQYDLAVCITGCFQYFYPIAPDAPGKVLSFMRNSAKYALFELYKKPQMGRTWKMLPKDDPFTYLLDEYEDLGDWVKHTKTFIGFGDMMKDTKVEHLAYYSMPVFLKKLKMHGFNNVHWAKEGRDSFVVLVS